MPVNIYLRSDIIIRFIIIALSTGAGAMILYYKGLAKTTASVLISANPLNSA